MIQGLEFSKQSIIDYTNLKDKIASNQAVFIVIEKENRCILRIMNTSEEAEKEIDNLQGHYPYGAIHFDVIGFKELRDKLQYLN